MDVMKINSKKILDELKRRNWKQKKLAAIIKMSPQAISMLLKRRTARLSTLNKIAKVFELDGKDLLH